MLQYLTAQVTNPAVVLPSFNDLLCVLEEDSPLNPLALTKLANLLFSMKGTHLLMGGGNNRSIAG